MNCLKIRGLDSNPSALIIPLYKPQSQQLFNQCQLTVIQCSKCKRIIHQSTTSIFGLRKSKDFSITSIDKLIHVSAALQDNRILLLCDRCKHEVGRVGDDQQRLIIDQRNVVTLLFYWHCQPKIATKTQKLEEPFRYLGAFSGLAPKSIISEINRLAYYKKEKYKLIFQYIQKIKNNEKAFNKFVDVIKVIEERNARQREI